MDIPIISVTPVILALALSTKPARATFSQSAQTWLSSLVMAALFFWLAGALPRVQAEGVVLQTLPWMPSLGLSLTFYLDGLSLLFALIITGVGALIFFYAGHYFEDAAEHNRFIVWLLAFAGAMLGVVLSGNLLMMFIAWELTSVTSFVLIGFNGAKDEAAREGAFKALFVTGGGALALIIGIVMLAAAAGQALHPEQSLHFVADLDAILQAEGLHQHDWFPLFAFLIVIGGFTKSAQFPFHFWLPGAMSAPTPASAYLHSATMVKAGIYLFARLSPVMYPHALWSGMLLSVGLITMLVGAYFAVKQRDLKGLLAYSTVSKLGAIVAMIGLPGQNGLKAAFIGIIAHALYKSALFLAAGAVDHATGTRLFSRLGGLRRRMPAMFFVVLASGLSMAGAPLLMGFVAKETMLDAMLQYTDSQATGLVMAVVFAASAFTAMAAFMLIYDVFLRRPPREPHYHQPPPLMSLGPICLALGSLSLGFLLEPLVIPLLELATPKTFKLALFPGFNEVFFLSFAILAAGLLLFVIRRPLIRRITFPLSGDMIYREVTRYIDWAGSELLRPQAGYLRKYLVYILGFVSIVLLNSGALSTVAAGQTFFLEDLSVTIPDLAKISMLVLAVAAAVFTVVARAHVQAAIAYGVNGYAIGVIFLIEHAPDLALMQLLVETMTTVLIIVILGRTPSRLRQLVMKTLWQGSHRSRLGILRDLALSIVIGSTVFVFALIALQNRPQRESIAEWHLAEAGSLNTEDVVGAIVVDFRATDTLLEIAVFMTAALGVLTLFPQGRDSLVIQRAAPASTAAGAVINEDEIQDATSLSTPFTRSVSYVVLAIAILIGFSQILYGGRGPGDGFTAGVTIGLAVSLWYVVFGYDEAKRQLWWFRPNLIAKSGLVLALFIGLFPFFIGEGFMGHVEFDRAMGIYDFVGSFGLHFTSSQFFEIAIALTVLGGLGMITEAINTPSPKAATTPDDAIKGKTA